MRVHCKGTQVVSHNLLAVGQGQILVLNDGALRLHVKQREILQEHVVDLVSLDVHEHLRRQIDLAVLLPSAEVAKDLLFVFSHQLTDGKASILSSYLVLKQLIRHLVTEGLPLLCALLLRKQLLFLVLYQVLRCADCPVVSVAVYLAFLPCAVVGEPDRNFILLLHELFFLFFTLAFLLLLVDVVLETLERLE